MTYQVNIIDVGIGNTASMENWLASCNFQSTTVRAPNEINAKTIILPGAGSAGTFMSKLQNSGFAEKIRELAINDCKIIGICLGFQVMFDRSEEDGGTDCLGLLNGSVNRLYNCNTHNGWEIFSIDKRKINFSAKYWPANSLRKQKIFGRVYYNHEYGVVTSNAKYQTISINETYRNYVGMLVHKNIVGMQFHPEKSQYTGKRILEFLVD